MSGSEQADVDVGRRTGVLPHDASQVLRTLGDQASERRWPAETGLSLSRLHPKTALPAIRPD